MGNLVCLLGGSAHWALTTELFDNMDETIDLLTSKKVEFAFVKLLPERQAEIFSRRLQTDMKVASNLRDLLRAVQQMRFRDATQDMKFGAVVAFLFGLVLWGLRKFGFSSLAASPNAKPG